MSNELQQVTRLASQYNLIPIVRYMMADTETPIRLFQHFAKEQHAFLLESIEGGAKWARYSFIGTDPFMMLYGKNGDMILEKGGRKEVLREQPLELLKARLRSFRTPSLPELPSFTGGAIGFFGYDLLQYYEKLPKHRVDDLQMNDMQFMFCDQIIVFDHFKQQLQIVGNVHIAEGATDAAIAVAYAEAVAKIEATIERLRQPVAIPVPTGPAIQADVEPTGIQSPTSSRPSNIFGPAIFFKSCCRSASALIRISTRCMCIAS
jgi:anthranilate synthase component 1